MKHIYKYVKNIFKEKKTENKINIIIMVLYIHVGAYSKQTSSSFSSTYIHQKIVKTIQDFFKIFFLFF